MGKGCKLKYSSVLREFNKNFGIRSVGIRSAIEARRGILIYFWLNPISTSKGLQVGDVLLPWAMIKNHNEKQHSVSLRLCNVNIRTETVDIVFKKIKTRIDFMYIRKIEIKELIKKSPV